MPPEAKLTEVVLKRVCAVPVRRPCEPKSTREPSFSWSLWELGELRQVIGDGEPRSFARNINMHLWADARIIIQRAQRQAKY